MSWGKLIFPATVTIVGNRLTKTHCTLAREYENSFHEEMFIADSGNNRVMIWDCSGIIEYEKATRDAKADFVRSDVGVGK